MTQPVRDAVSPLGPGAIQGEIDDLVVSLERDQARAMFGFVRRLGLSPEQSEDAVQDVLLRLWATLDSGRLEFLVSRQDPDAADLRFPIGDLLIHRLWVDGTLAELFSHHPDDNVIAIEPTESPAPS